MRHTGTLELETDRLLLRRLLPQDAPQMYANWANDPAVTRFLRWEPHKSPAETHHAQGTEHTGKGKLFDREILHDKLAPFQPSAAAQDEYRRSRNKKAGNRYGRCGRNLLVSSHAGTRLPIAAFIQGSGRSPSAGCGTSAEAQKNRRGPARLLLQKIIKGMTSYGGIIRIR